MVRQAGSVRAGKGQNQEGEKKRDWEKQELRQMLVDLTNWQQTNREHNINTQGIMGKMRDTWRGVETITKTGEAD